MSYEVLEAKFRWQLCGLPGLNCSHRLSVGARACERRNARSVHHLSAKGRSLCSLIDGECQIQHAFFLAYTYDGSMSLVCLSVWQDGEGEEDHSECLLTLIAQMNPNGWIWRQFGYQHSILRQVDNHNVKIWPVGCIMARLFLQSACTFHQ